MCGSTGEEKNVLVVLEKKVSFAWSVNRIGRIVFWSCFEGLVGFVHSKRELVVEILFFFHLPGKKPSWRGGVDTVWIFPPGESVKNQEAEVYFSWERH